MTTMASTAALKGWDKLLKTAQRGPVTIEDRGEPVAVMLSKTEYDVLQSLKFEKLRADIQIGIDELDRGEGRPMEEVFARFAKAGSTRRKSLPARKAT